MFLIKEYAAGSVCSKQYYHCHPPPCPKINKFHCSKRCIAETAKTKLSELMCWLMLITQSNKILEKVMKWWRWKEWWTTEAKTDILWVLWIDNIQYICIIHTHNGLIYSQLTRDRFTILQDGPKTIKRFTVTDCTCYNHPCLPYAIAEEVVVEKKTQHSFVQKYVKRFIWSYYEASAAWVNQIK